MNFNQSLHPVKYAAGQGAAPWEALDSLTAMVGFQGYHAAAGESDLARFMTEHMRSRFIDGTLASGIGGRRPPMQSNGSKPNHVFRGAAAHHSPRDFELTRVHDLKPL